MEFASYLGNKLFLPELVEGMLYELDMQDPQKNGCQTCLKVRWSSGVPDSLKRLLDLLQDTEESDLQTANISGIVFDISCFMKKSAKYYGSVG